MNSQPEVKPRRWSADNSKLPDAKDALKDEAVRAKVSDLLGRAHAHKAVIDLAEERLKECRNELAAIAMGYDLPGIRSGRLGIYVGGYKSRRSLSAKKLVELGVDPDLIDQAYEAGSPYLDCRLVEFDE